MMRVHRTWHVRVWLMMAPVTAAILIAAIAARAERRTLLESAAPPACCRGHAPHAEGQP